MLKFCANLSFLFQELSFPDRFHAAALHGFRGVEYLFPYEWPAREISECLRSNKLTQVLFNLPAGDWAAGERGYACHPGRREEFQEGVFQALEYAQALDCTRLHVMAGLTPQNTAPEEIQATFVENVRWAAGQCQKRNVQLLIEPINSRIDMPGYWLDTPQKAFTLHKEIAHPALKVQIDLYHTHVMGFDWLALLESCLEDIGHLQIADYPGRHEPGGGEIAYPQIFRFLEIKKYSGWIGCEYKPSGLTTDSLHWRQAYLSQEL